LHRLYPRHFDLDKFDRLLVHRGTLEALRNGKSLAETRRPWATALDDFKRRREKVLLYK
jgi:hypothetical protein